jgi:hypothetical protein
LHTLVIKTAGTQACVAGNAVSENQILFHEFTSVGNSMSVSLTYIIFIDSPLSENQLISSITYIMKSSLSTTKLQETARIQNAPLLQTASVSSFTITCLENCSTPPSSSSYSSSKDASKIVLIIAVVVPCALVFLIILLYFLYWFRQKQGPPVLLDLSPPSAPPVAYSRLSTTSVYPTVVESEVVSQPYSGSNETVLAESRLICSKEYQADPTRYAVVCEPTDLAV